MFRRRLHLGGNDGFVCEFGSDRIDGNWLGRGPVEPPELAATLTLRSATGNNCLPGISHDERGGNPSR